MLLNADAMLSPTRAWATRATDGSCGNRAPSSGHVMATEGLPAVTVGGVGFEDCANVVAGTDTVRRKAAIHRRAGIRTSA